MTLPANGLCTLNGVTSVPVIPLGHFVAFSVRIKRPLRRGMKGFVLFLIGLRRCCVCVELRLRRGCGS
jgi:hypothetical protein